MRSPGLAALLLASLLWPLPLPAQPRDVVIGTTAGQLPSQATAVYETFTGYLEARIPNTRFRLLTYPNIEALIAAVDSSQLDFALLTPAAYTELRLRHPVRPIATVTQQLDSAVYPWLAAAVFTPDEAGYPESMADVAGRSVLGLATMAVGGWLAAEREWRALGLDPAEDFARLDFLFDYAGIVQQVCSGSVEVGVLPAGVFNALRGSCERPLRVLHNPLFPQDPRYPAEHSTRLYPEVAVAALGEQQSEDLVIAMAMALLSIQPGSEVARAVNVAGFTTPLSYESVASLLQELRVGPFADYGRFTFTEFLQQHSSKVLGVLLLFVALLGYAFARSQQLNRRLKQSEQFRRLLFERSTLPIVLMDRATLELVDLNAAALALYGYRQREELIGKTPLDVSAPQQKDGRATRDIVRQLADMHAEPGAGSFEWLHQRPDGSLWEAEVHLLAIEFGGRQLLQATMIDVTERNRIRDDSARLSQQLHHAQRLESLGRLSGAIAHDFNNLLTVINGYSELLLLSLDKQSPNYRTVLEIAQAGWRARDLTNQLLTFGRRQIGSVRPIDVNAMILDAGNMFRSLLGEQIRLQTTLDTRPGLVLADAGQLSQVLMNLLANARDAMPEGGTCYLTTMRKQVAAEEAAALGIAPGECMLVSVTDTGMGMTPDVQEHIFEPFFSTKGDKGNGIGLASAYGIIRQSGGGISFVSRPGQGSSFSICLPLTTQEVPAGSTAAAEPADLRASAPWRVLVVEDQPDVRLYACSVLRSAGYKVLEAESGEKALELARSRAAAVDLLFTDVVMPGMNGRELAERFCREWPGTRVLFTSGYADDEVALHGVVQDRIQFIAKPYVPQHLLSIVKATLSQESLRLP